MKLNIIALALVLSTSAFAQTNPGSSPLTGAKGGTNNGFMQFTGPAASLKTFTLPNASDTIATLAAVQTLTNKTFVCANQTSCVVRIANDVSGLGTNVATALAVNVGSAGAFVTFNGALGTPSSGVGTNLTGTAAGLTAGNATLAATVTTNANLTGPVTSVGNATTIGANQVTRAMEAQGVARSVIGVTGNAGANVADIQGTADQALVVNSAGTALAFGKVNLTAAAGATGTLPVANGGTGDTGTAWTAFTPSYSCGTATFTNNSARSKTIGKTTFLQFDFTISAIGTCTVQVNITLPNTAQSAGSMAGRELVISGVQAMCFITSGSATMSCIKNASAVFVVNDRLAMSGVYENQ